MRGASQWLLDNLPRGSVLVVMAENSVAVAVMTMAAYATGTILCPISPAYGVAGGDHARLRHVFNRTKPAAIFADPVPKYAEALAAIGSTARVITRDPAAFGGEATAFADVIATDADARGR